MQLISININSFHVICAGFCLRYATTLCSTWESVKKSARNFFLRLEKFFSFFVSFVEMKFIHYICRILLTHIY